MEQDDFSIEMPEEGENKRKAYRVRATGLELWIPKLNMSVAVSDISASGIALHEVPEGALAWGEVFACDLLLNKKLYIAGLFAKVRRLFANGEAGCTFEELDPRKESRLDKLVLEVQKRLIALRHVQEEDR
ncbi:PilZ domain-containing protein [Megalodesulfovibrio paquesii]